jgi:large subunit ribosomal protein L28
MADLFSSFATTPRRGLAPRLHWPADGENLCDLREETGFGNNRSHSMVATKRRFDPNLQRVRVLLHGKATRAYVCTRCLKAGKVTKAIT